MIRSPFVLNIVFSNNSKEGCHYIFGDLEICRNSNNFLSKAAIDFAKSHIEEEWAKLSPVIICYFMIS